MSTNNSKREEEIKVLQTDEIEALSAIFGNDWKCQNENGNVFSILVVGETVENGIELQVTLTEGYPLFEPPIYELSAPWLKRDDKLAICNSLENIYCEHIGESIIFLWIENLKESIDKYKFPCDGEPQSSNLTEEITNQLVSLEMENDTCNDIIPLFHGLAITDRKSTFQAHLAIVVSIEQVKEVTRRLLENRKIASATHNVSAYRIYIESRKTYLQDCDDDGETHAGSRLLHLLQILDVKNALIIVSRWFGGIQLGPDRFKHINNVARDILKQHNLIQEPKEESLPSAKSKRKKK